MGTPDLYPRASEGAQTSEQIPDLVSASWRSIAGTDAPPPVSMHSG